MSLVKVDIPLHNVLVVGSCGTLLVLCLIQILLYLILRLCIHLDLLAVRCTVVPGYTMWGYIVATHYCIATAHCFTIVVDYCIVMVPGLNEVKLVLSSFILAPSKYLKLFLSSAPSS